jgi:hypothetical protein
MGHHPQSVVRARGGGGADADPVREGAQIWAPRGDREGGEGVPGGEDLDGLRDGTAATSGQLENTSR